MGDIRSQESTVAKGLPCLLQIQHDGKTSDTVMQRVGSRKALCLYLAYT